MRREIILKPKANAVILPGGYYPGNIYPNGNPYGGSDQMALWEVWARGDAPTGPGETGTLAHSPYWEWHGAGVSVGQAFVSFDTGPTLALFEKVTFQTAWDYAASSANNWWFPPDNTNGPRLQITMYGRDGTTQHSCTAFEIGYSGGMDNGDDLYFREHMGGGAGYKGAIAHTWELTSHPEGGPWTLEDINNLRAGVTLTFTNGPNGKPYDGGDFNKTRVFKLWVALEIEDLGGYVRSIRHNASATLRLKRKARNTILYSVPAADVDTEVGGIVNISRSGVAATGDLTAWGAPPLERRSGYLAARTYWPEAMRCQDEAYDLHDFSCEAWGAFRIPIAWTPELSGLAYLDQGGDFTLTRDQDAWSLRPGDGSALRVLKAYPNLSEEGLAVHSAGDIEECLYNSMPNSAGWSTTGAGGGAVTYTVSKDTPVVDELGYADTLKMVFGGAAGTSGKSRTLSLTAGDMVNLRVRVRNLSVDDPNTKFLEVAFSDNSGNYWNAGSRSWGAGAHYNPIPAAGAFGEVVSDHVPITGTGTYTISVGRFSSAISNATFAIALVDVQKGTSGCGMPIVSLASTITRLADVFSMNNASPFTFWHQGRGMAVVEFRPFWMADKLVATTEKRLIQADHAAASFDRLSFVAGATDKFVGTRYDGVTTQTVSLNVLDANGSPYRLTRANVVRVFLRWLDADGWREQGPYVAGLGYALYLADGTFLAYHETAAPWSAPVTRAEASVSFAGLDGWVRYFEVKHNPVSGSEAVWRR
jgi:hypothetical protein